MSWLQNKGIDGLEFPIQLYLICYQVLHLVSNNDPVAQSAAQKALSSGYILLIERAARIHDDTLRRQFLESVPFNRELRAAYRASGEVDYSISSRQQTVR
jgi:hypothetical protein